MALLDIEGVDKSFGGIHALQKLSLSLAEGRITGLIGPNGAGKTTAFHVVTGFLKPDSGSVKYRSQPILGLPPHKVLATGIARSFQDVRIPSKLTVLENVLLGRQGQSGEHFWLAIFNPRLVAREERAHREAVMAYLEMVGLASKANVRSDELSFSELKLLAIARLLATEAKLFLLDEPTSGLDPATVQGMLRLIRETVVRGRTVCIIEHNLDVVRDLCDYIFFLDQGSVVASGPPSEILKDPKLGEIYFGY